MLEASTWPDSRSMLEALTWPESVDWEDWEGCRSFVGAVGSCSKSEKSTPKAGAGVVAAGGRTGS